jgi:hypothetical protein
MKGRDTIDDLPTILAILRTPIPSGSEYLKEENLTTYIKLVVKQTKGNNKKKKFNDSSFLSLQRTFKVPMYKNIRKKISINPFKVSLGRTDQK